MARKFTLREAESLLPRLTELLHEAVALKAGYQAAERRFASLTSRIAMLGGANLDQERAAEARRGRDGAAERLNHAIAAIHETGCVVKDLDIGLLDFPALFRGREVYLCWKLGEPAIRFWHGIDEGFAGRKPIGAEFLESS